MTYVIGLDIGTTSAKAVLFDKSGNVKAEQEQKYPLLHPFANWAEQDPLQIEKAAKQVIKSISEKFPIMHRELLGVGISSAMHTLICVDKCGTPLSNSLTWGDSRSTRETDYLKATRPEIYFQTGTPLHPMTPLLKLIWMKNNDFSPYLHADKYISIKEFLIKRWFGQEVVDYSVASATGLFDAQKLTWNDDALDVAGISKENLYKPVPPTHPLVGLDKKVAIELGLHPDTPFIIGASDGPLANLGVGAIDPGDTAITIGTSGAIRQFTNKPLLNEAQEVFSYRFDEDSWITGGASNNGGIVLTWLQSVLGTERPITIDEMNTLAGKSTVGANKLFFLPYINAERALIWDGHAKASFIGLNAIHQNSDIIRAAMEGVIFNIFQIGQALFSLNNKNGNLYANGGFSKSALWVQILADIFGQQVKQPVSHQSSAWGAAWLALFGLGEVPSLGEIKDVIPMKETVEPNMENHQAYKELFAIYKDIYKGLKDTFKRLDNL